MAPFAVRLTPPPSALSPLPLRPPTLPLLLLSLLCLPSSSQGIPPYHLRPVVMDGFGDQACQKHLEKTETRLSGIVFSHQPYPSAYAAERNCFLIFKAPKGYRIRLTVLEFSVSGDGQHCTKDSLHVFDQEEELPSGGGTSFDGPGPILGQFCGALRNGTLLAESTLNVLTLWWHTDDKSDNDRPNTGFRLLWTVFRDSASGCEGASEFSCGGGECIPAELACDRLPHCRDGSDQQRPKQAALGCDMAALRGAGVLDSLSDAALGAICLGTVLGSVVLVVGFLICCRDRCRRPPPAHGPHSTANLSQPSDTYLLPPPPRHPADLRTNSSSSPTYAKIPPQPPPSTAYGQTFAQGPAYGQAHNPLLLPQSHLRKDHRMTFNV